MFNIQHKTVGKHSSSKVLDNVMKQKCMKPGLTLRQSCNKGHLTETKKEFTYLIYE